MHELFKGMCREYRLHGEYAGYQVIKSGNINDTYVINTSFCGGERSYLFQRINLNVFRSPMFLVENAEKISDHLCKQLENSDIPDKDRLTVKFYRKPNGDTLHYDESGSCWRVTSFIYNARSFDVADNRILHSTGKAFGRFQRMLASFPADELAVTLPDFHNTEKRFSDLFKAAETDAFGRLHEVRDAFDYLMSMREQAFALCRMQASGALPIRVCHNDTKCNNVMFDIYTDAPLAVIDLDTVMGGLMGHDFGDGVRFAANSAREDEENISLVSLDLERFRAFAEGFVGEVKDMITPAELDTLAQSVLVITLELAARFLTDHLCGDVYFKVKRNEHNKIRAYSQIALAKDICRKMDIMQNIIYEIVDKNAEN